MSLDRKNVERIAGEHIRELQQTRHVSAEEKKRIRKMHEGIAEKVERESQ